MLLGFPVSFEVYKYVFNVLITLAIYRLLDLISTNYFEDGDCGKYVCKYRVIIYYLCIYLYRFFKGDKRNVSYSKNRMKFAKSYYVCFIFRASLTRRVCLSKFHQLLDRSRKCYTTSYFPR